MWEDAKEKREEASVSVLLHLGTSSPTLLHKPSSVVNASGSCLVSELISASKKSGTRKRPLRTGL